MTYEPNDDSDVRRHKTTTNQGRAGASPEAMKASRAFINSNVGRTDAVTQLALALDAFRSTPPAGGAGEREHLERIDAAMTRYADDCHACGAKGIPLHLSTAAARRDELWLAIKPIPKLSACVTYCAKCGGDTPYATVGCQKCLDKIRPLPAPTGEAGEETPPELHELFKDAPNIRDLPTVEAGEGEVLRYVKGIARQNTYEERAEKWHSENEGDYEGGEDLEDIYDKVILDARAVLAHLHDTTKGGEGGGA